MYYEKRDHKDDQESLKGTDSFELIKRKGPTLKEKEANREAAGQGKVRQPTSSFALRNSVLFIAAIR